MPKSVLLIGPRQVGKSTLIKSLKPDLEINLADQEVFYRFTSNPAELREQINSKTPKTVFIDEVQKFPALLNTVQVIIDGNKKIKFYLTGSSARKLKRGRANLLPGRVINCYLGPLIASELDYKMSTKKMMQFGALPEIYLMNNESMQKAMLRSYISSYVQEEIKAEAMVRQVDTFARAMPYVFQSAGHFVDYSKLAKQAKVSRQMLSKFYEIFEDTLIGTRLWPDTHLIEIADLVKHPKFYAFDLGVLNGMLGSFDVSEDRKGGIFEHLIVNQITHSAWAKALDAKMATFRTRGGLEVDFILTLEGRRFAIEAKAKNEFYEQDVASLKKLRDQYEKKIGLFGVHLGADARKVSGIWCLPWQTLLKELGL